MQKTNAAPAVQKKLTEVDSKLIDALKAQNLIAANSTPRHAPAKIVDDVEDMWDNLPV